MRGSISSSFHQNSSVILRTDLIVINSCVMFKIIFYITDLKDKWMRNTQIFVPIAITSSFTNTKEFHDNEKNWIASTLVHYLTLHLGDKIYSSY